MIMIISPASLAVLSATARFTIPFNFLFLIFQLVQHVICSYIYPISNSRFQDVHFSLTSTLKCPLQERSHYASYFP